MITTKVIQGIIPPGGWHFKVDERTRLASSDFPRLVQMLADYRVSNMLPLGDPLKDLEDYICTTWPHMCHKAGPNARVSIEVVSLPKPDMSGAPTLVDQMIKWLDDMTAGVSMDNIVLEPEARRRADICASCPNNVKWKTGCGTCNDNIERVSGIVRMGRRLLKNPRLKACGLTFMELKAAVWLRRERVVREDATLPDYCWAKRRG